MKINNVRHLFSVSVNRKILVTTFSLYFLISGLIIYQTKYLKYIDPVQKAYGASSVTLTLANTSRIVNQDGLSAPVINGTPFFIGGGYDASSSYLGMKFNGATALAGSSIISATLYVRSNENVWIQTHFNIYAEASNTPADYTSSVNNIWNRNLTDAYTCISEDTAWTVNTEYAFDATAAVQEVVSNYSSDFVNLIVRNTSEGPFSRKYIRYTSGSTPRLVINYQ